MSDTKETKTLMVLSAEDRGKDEFINSLANHLWDVKVPDRFRFKVAVTKELATSCKVYKLNITKQNYNIAIVDVPEFSNEETSKVLKHVVKECKELKLTKFHALNYVMRASDRRLTNGEKEVFSKVSKLFVSCSDINIIATSSSDVVPPIKNALIADNIRHDNIFKLNTIFIDNGTSNFEGFFEYLDSVTLPQDMNVRSRNPLSTIGRQLGKRWRSATRERK